MILNCVREAAGSILRQDTDYSNAFCRRWLVPPGNCQYKCLTRVTTTSSNVKVTQSISATRCLEGSRKLRFPDFITTAQDGGKFVSLTHRSFLPPGNPAGTHFC